MARADPQRLAVADGRRSLTYGELQAGAEALGRRLRALGVGPGIRVALCHDRSAVSIVGALAVLEAGGAYVGLDPAHPDRRLQHVLDDAAVPVLLTQRSVVDRLHPSGVEVIDLDAAFDDDDDDLIDDGQDGALRNPAFERGACGDGAAGADIAYVIYTSGSTGEPKGVEVTSANLASLVDWHNTAFSVTASDRASVVASPAFDASVWEVWPYLAAGASLHVPSPVAVAAPHALRDWIVDTGITIAFVPTPLAEVLLDLEWPRDVALRTLLTGGDRLQRRPAPGTPFELVNNYGLTEATVVSTSGPVAPGDGSAAPPSIGRAIAGTRLYVLDQHGRPMPPGELGELHIGGSGVARGYLNRNGLTRERFRPDPFAAESGARLYATGDLVRRSPDGEVHYHGRLDDQVQIRGHRVEPAEIAAALMTHAGIGSCMVDLREGERGDPRLVAYVVASSAADPAPRELRDHLSARLPAHMVPSAFVLLDALPTNSAGKLDRAALPDPLPEDVGREDGRSSTGVEAEVISILEDLLELRGVGPDDNFFELGGHSLLGAQLVARIEDRFDIELPLLTIFDNPTAAGIASELELEAGCAAPRQELVADA